MGFFDFLQDPINFLSQWLLQLLTGWGLQPAWAEFLLYALGAAALATSALLFTLILIWAERKIIGRVQDRLGPNRVGPWGIFQTIADMIKIFIKEHIIPSKVDPVPYHLAPVMAVAAVLLVWAVVPFSNTVIGSNLNVGLLFIIAVSGLGEFGILMAGWGSYNKYALIAAFRASAQLISYELPMVITLLIPVMLSGSMGLNDIVKAQQLPFLVVAPLAALIFFIAQIAENGRAPFDLAEAESEIVAGFNTEYSGLKFGMFYVADFLHAFTGALVFSTIFLGGWRGPGAAEIPVLGFVYLMAKSLVIWFVGVWIRGSLPRFRIDQMMNINWKILTPVSLVLFMLTALLDKLVGGSMIWIRYAVILAVNLGLMILVARMITRFVFVEKEITEVGDRNRPVASPNNIFTGSQSGVSK